MRRNRFKVALRPKLRRRRLRQCAVWAMLLMLGAGAFLTMRHFKAVLPSLAVGWEEKFSPRLSSISVEGVPEALRERLHAFLEATRGSAEQRARALAKAFPCLARVKVRRDWMEGTVRFEIVARRAVASVVAQGRVPTFLDEEGVVFTAPEGVYAAAAISVEPGSADSRRLKELPDCLRSVSRPGALPSALRRMRFVSEEQGWEAVLEDGTRVLWGGLGWTQEKLARLNEVLQDARARYEGVLTADLRYFEDGKVLLRLPEKGI